MYEEFDWLAFILGLPTGLAIAGVVIYFNWRKGKKERRFDERYTRIHQHARSFSWIVTYFAIIIAWFIVILVEGVSLSFFIVTGLWVAHMISYVIGAAIASRKN
jgi:hypothetical protein